MEGNYKSRQQNNDCAQSAMNLLSVQWSCLGQGVSKYRTGDGEMCIRDRYLKVAAETEENLENCLKIGKIAGFVEDGVFICAI